MRKYLVYGDEPYLVDQFRRELTGKVEVPEFNLLETCEFTETEKNFISQYPLMAERKVLVFRTKALKEAADLIEYISSGKSMTEVYVFCEEIDKRTSAYKAFKKNEIKVFNKLAKDVLEKTIMQYIRKSGCAIRTDAYHCFLQLVNYYSEETNLYDVLHSLERICASKEVTKEIVESIVLDRAQEDIYILIQLICQKKYMEMFRQADLILQNQQNNVIGVLSLLLRSYRLAYKMQACSCKLKDLGVNYRTYIPRLPAEDCHQAMNVIDDVIMKIKQGFYRPDIALKVTLSRLCNL